MLSVSGVDKNIFLQSNSIKMLPTVSAEWNQNIFNAPYLTVAGDGTKQSLSNTAGSIGNVTDSNKHPSFNTHSYTISKSSDVITYSVTPSTPAPAYKIVTYFTTNGSSPIIVNTSATGSSNQYGSSSSEISSFGWTKVETYIGGSSENISSFTYSMIPNQLSTDESTLVVLYFTEPEIYATTYYDYQYGSVWSTDSVFSGFRPGESYVTTGNAGYSLPSGYRQVTNNSLLKGHSNFHMPVCPLYSAPKFFMTSTPTPMYKHSLFTDISAYKYFVSDVNSSTSISAMYASPILMNKVVLKFNTYLSVPKVTVTVTLSDNTTISSSEISPDDAGMLILYLRPNSLTTSKWSYMPSINSDGTLSNAISISKITVTATSSPTISSDFSAVSNSYISTDKNRLHIIEVSPRLELDLTQYVMNITVNKSLDSKDTYMPISSIVTDDATISLSGIPEGDINSPIPIFSNTSNYSSTKLAGLLRKNIKFYINYNLVDYVDYSTNVDTTVNKIIPGGVWYSDTWQQNDIDTISISTFDSTRYLQSTPASDYVSNFKDAFDVITNLLDLSGFTDYDPDSLYAVTNDDNVPLNMNYYFCSSKDTTIADALNQIFLPYQIAAYIDNYGVMKFLSLSNIMQKTNMSEDFAMDDSNVVQNGYSITNKAKPGKISLRYTTPRLKQSLALQNVTNPDISKGPGFVFTTSNDVVWEQQSIDAVGLNYLSESMDTLSNKFKLNSSDLLDLFHTFNLNNNGYAAIENEIVSFVYKEYQISKTDGSSEITVSVKNDLELAEKITKYVKDYQVGMIQNYGSISAVSHSTTGGINYNTYTYSPVNSGFSVKAGDYVTVSGMNPDTLNISAQIVAATSSTFKVVSSQNVSMISGGQVTKGLDYDVVITPTGYVTNIQRGLFGTPLSSHNVIASPGSGDVITNKDIKISNISSSGTITSQSSNYSVVESSNRYINVSPPTSGKTLIYPNTSVDNTYNTYSTKFYFEANTAMSSAGLFFNLDTGSTTNTVYLELVRYDASSVVGTRDYKYLIILSQQGNSTPLAYADVTGLVQSVVMNFEKLYIKNSNPTQKDGSDAYLLYVDPHESFNLRFTKYPYNYVLDGEGSATDPSLGSINGFDINGYVYSVFLNNFEVKGWQQYNNSAWSQTDINNLTGLRKKITLPAITTTNKKFGAFVSASPTVIPNQTHIVYPTSDYSSGTILAYVREIYASQKSLKERSVNYYFQDREFLNGLVQNQRLFSNYKEYMMQTQPTVVGINTYDVQYTNGAAVSVDIAPSQYTWQYYPGNTLLDQRFIQHQDVDEYSVSYSTPVNTGFRGKFAAVNNSSHMVFLKKDSDDLNAFVVTFNLWTHEIIVPSDPENIEYVTDPGNILETMQIDSAFIQSKDSAIKLLRLVGHSLDNFSKDITLNIFGNPLIEVGDIVSLVYPLMGVNQQKYIVHSVSNSYNNGLSTQLTLNMINKGSTPSTYGDDAYGSGAYGY